MVSNERLEFLGDAVLDLVIAEYLFSLHTKVDEGELTKMRSWLVNKKTLALAAKRMQLDSFLMLSFSASKALEKGSDSILSDALEAVIGAIYFDKGIEGAKKFILNSLLPLFTHQEVMIDNNYKSIFLEKVQSEGKTSPWYNVIEESGPDHDKQFLVGAYIGDELISTGEGKNKKDAEQSAARNALTILDFRKANNLKMAENFNN
jgi:ribonuclease-3